MSEATRHRRAFDLYLRMGAERSIAELQELIAEDPSRIGISRAPTLRTLESWSASFNWRDRIGELEREAATRNHDDQVQVIREMNERHAKEGVALQQKGVGRLQTLSAEKMTGADAMRSIVEGARLERMARGGVEIRREGEDDDIELSTFTEEELKRLAALGDRRATGASEEEPR